MLNGSSPLTANREWKGGKGPQKNCKWAPSPELLGGWGVGRKVFISVPKQEEVAPSSSLCYAVQQDGSPPQFLPILPSLPPPFPPHSSLHHVLHGQKRGERRRRKEGGGDWSASSLGIVDTDVGLPMHIGIIPFFVCVKEERVWGLPRRI